MLAIPFEGEHRIDQMLQQFRARQLTLLGHMAHHDHGRPGDLGNLDEVVAAASELGG